MVIEHFLDALTRVDPTTLALAVTALLACGALLVCRRSKAAAAGKRRPPAPPRAKPETVLRQSRQSARAPLFTKEDPAKEAVEVVEWPAAAKRPDTEGIEVSETDPMDEIAVYMKFGYWELAAKALQRHIDDSGAEDKELLKKLLELHFRSGRIDDYASTLERICALGVNEEALRKAILAGLEKDHDNLVLRVLAESRLQLGVEQLDELLGVVHEPLPGPTGTGAAAAPARTGEAPTADDRRLVLGDIRIAPLSQEEKVVLAAFGEPGRSARLHLALGDVGTAIAQLLRAIELRPRVLEHYADVLRLLRGQRAVEPYAATLWRLFAVLGNAGRQLRERFLGAGLELGQHPLLTALVGVREPWQVDEIGRRFGLVPAAPVAPRRLPLVLEVAREEDAMSAAPARERDDLLAEIDGYLEFGQVDMALERLERAIAEDPQRIPLYRPLLDLYERMEAFDRLDALATTIKKKAQRPPEEVVPMMSQAYRRLQQRTRLQVAG